MADGVDWKAGTRGGRPMATEYKTGYVRLVVDASGAKSGGREVKRELTELNQAVKRVATTVDSFSGGELTRLGQRGRRTGQQLQGATAGVANLNRGVKSVGGSMASTRPQIQQASFQIGDFATQVGAGTAASVALGQQLPQLLGGFGALGAVMGAAVAIGVPLAAVFLGMGDDARTLEERLEGVNTALDEYRRHAQLVEGGTAAIVEEFGAATAAVRELIAAQRELERTSAISEAAALFERLTESFADLDVQNSPMIRGFGMTEGVIELCDELGLTRKEAKALQSEIVDANTSAEIADQAAALARMRDLLVDQHGAIGKLPPEVRELVGEINGAERALRRVLGATDSLPGSLAAATDQAVALADEIRRAADAASSFEQGATTRLVRAQIRQELVGDPVGEAAALAAADFDARVGDTSGLDPILQEALAGKRESAISDATEAARIEEATREAQRALRPSSGGSRSGNRAARDAERQREREIENFKRLEEAMNPVLAAERELAAAQDVLNIAVERGLTTEEQAAGIYSRKAESLAAQLDPLAAIHEGLDAELELARLANGEREIEASLRQHILELQAQGIELDAMEVDALRSKLEELQRLEAGFASLRDTLGTVAGAFGTIADMAESSLGRQSAAYKAAFAVTKAAALASAIVDTHAAVTKALASAPPPMSYVNASIAAAAGAAEIASITATTISGFQTGGFTGAGAHDAPAGVVHREEFVVNAPATKAHRGLLEDINAGRDPARGEGAGRSVRIINVLDPALVGQYLNSPEGDELIMNKIARSGAAS